MHEKATETADVRFDERPADRPRGGAIYVAGRCGPELLVELDEFTARHRWSRAAAINVAIERLVAADARNVVTTEVRG
jgi:hypothetical protein